EVYEFYDAPRLFVCRNLTDSQYLAVWIDDDDKTDTWLFVSISMRRFQEIRSGGIDLYDAFKCAETGYVFRVVAPRVDGISSVESVESANIDDESLPERDE